MRYLQSLILAAAAPGLLLDGAAAESMFTLSGCGGDVLGRPGEVRTAEYLATITVTGQAAAEAVCGWIITLGASGGTVKAIDLKGLHVSTLFDDDDDLSTPPVPRDVDLVDAGIATAEVIEGSPRKVTSTVVLHLLRDMVLAEGTYAIARISIDLPFNADGSCHLLETDFTASGEPGLSVLLTRGGQSTARSFPCLAQLRPDEERFTLSVVPAGANPVPGMDFVLAGNVPPGDFLLDTEIVLTSNEPLSGVIGPQGWLLSVVHDEPCMEVESMTLDGIHVSTAFDHDGNPQTPPLDPYPLDLRDAAFKILSKAQGTGAGLPASARGFVCAVILATNRLMALHMNSTDRILRVIYRVPVSGGQTTECRVAFVDGLKGPGAPFHNGVHWMGTETCPALKTQGLVVRLTGKEPVFRRGDANGDGGRDLSDAVFLLENLFLGGPRPACRKTGDLDDNGVVDITDPIYLLSFLFLGGPPAAEPRLCGTDPTADDLTCFEDPHCG